MKSLSKITVAAILLAGVSFAGFAADEAKSTAPDVAKLAAAQMEKVQKDTITLKGEDGWLYSKNELQHLAAGPLADGKIKEHSKSTKKENADPIPAMVAFHEELKAAGIKLLVVPIPPKAALQPWAGLKKGDAMLYLTPFYTELKKNGIEVVDLYSAFAESKVPVYCKQDAHWNPAGIAIAAKKIAEASGLKAGETAFPAKEEKIKIVGDLMLSLDKNASSSEEITIKKYTGDILSENSPVLLIGDSHTLVFSSGADMLAENAGLAETLAAELKMPIERIGVKGSASTAVRTNLYRKSAKNAQWLKSKKVVVWCFTCREFTESTSGWLKVPAFKK